MKLVLAAMLVVFSASSWAASSVRVYPEYPIDHCDFSRGYLINALFGTTVEEDNTELSINFFTYYYGACKDRVAILEPIPRKSPLAFWVEGINWPWTPSPFEEILDYDKESKILEVTLIFNKIEGFKEKKKRHVDYVFAPIPNTRFHWNIDMEQLSPSKTRVYMNHQRVGE